MIATLCRYSFYFSFISPTLDSEFEVEIISAVPLQNYTYQLISKGKVVKSQTVAIPGNKNNNLRLKLQATYDLAPKAHLIIYVVHAGKIIDSTVTIELRKRLANFIDLTLTPETAKPAETIEIAVKSNPKSFIGLLGVDQSVLLLKSGNDFAIEEAFRELDSFNVVTTSNRIYYDPETSKPNPKIPDYYNLWDSFAVIHFSYCLFETNF